VVKRSATTCDHGIDRVLSPSQRRVNVIPRQSTIIAAVRLAARTAPWTPATPNPLSSATRTNRTIWSPQYRDRYAFTSSSPEPKNAAPQNASSARPIGITEARRR
jgi:hypothetical protein